MRFFALVTAILLLICPTPGTRANEQVRASNAGGEAITIDNGLLSISYSPENGTLSAQRGKKLFITQVPWEEVTAAGDVAAQTLNMKNEFGTGKAIELKFPSCRIYTFALYNNVPFICIETSLHNPTDKTQVVNKLDSPSFAIDLGKRPKDLRALGCDGLTAADTERSSYTFLAVADRQTTAGVVCGWVTQNRGSGIVSSKPDNDLVAISPWTEYGKLLVPPGKTVKSETFVIGSFDNALSGLEAYAEVIAKTHEIKLPKIPSGYCTWYSKPHGGASDEKHLAELAEFCEENLTKFGFDTLQIDDKWQISRRDFTDYNPKGPFPAGMKATAENITEVGMAAGIWFIPFGWDHKREIFADHQDWFVHREDGSVYSVHWAGDCLDMTHPEARKFLDNAIRRMTREWGYKYIKIDGLWTGMAVKILYPQPTYRPDGIGDAVFENPEKTNVEAYRDGLKLVRKAAGKDVYRLGCNIAQNMRTLGGSFGLVDGMRVGSDTGARWGGIMRGAHMGSRLYFFHNRVWHNDPDCLMLRDPLTIQQAQCWAGWIGVTGQLNMVSEWLPGLPGDKLDAFKRSIPNHGLTSRPIDLFENDPAKIWRLTSGKGQERIDIAGLFNWSEKEPTSIKVDLNTLDLPKSPTGSYIGFDYWADDFIAPFTGTFKTDLAPSSSRIIALKPLLDRPVLVSTSRHVTQGIIDIVKQSWNGKTNTLAGKSKVVGGDPYEVRIFAPSESWQIDSATLGKSDKKASVTVSGKQTKREIRVTINSPTNRDISWKIGFKKN